jgi:putative hydrolase of the HAD superfamily
MTTFETTPTTDLPSQPPPKGLLLDFGSVISISVFERHRETERLLGLAEGTLTWQGPLKPETDALWQSMQRDEITERDYWAIRARELGATVGEPDWDVMAMLTRIRQVDPNTVVRPAMAVLMTQAHRLGIQIGILTNEMELFYGKPFLERMRVLKLVSSVVDATHNGILKPDPRAYALSIDAMGLQPEEILFVDDQFRNIAGAVQCGLQTQLFELRDIGGSIAAISARLQLFL